MQSSNPYEIRKNRWTPLKSIEIRNHCDRFRVALDNIRVRRIRYVKNFATLTFLILKDYLSFVGIQSSQACIM